MARLNEFSNLCRFQYHREIRRPQLIGTTYIQLSLFHTQSISTCTQHTRAYIHRHISYSCAEENCDSHYQPVLRHWASIWNCVDTVLCCTSHTSSKEDTLKSCGGVEAMMEMKCFIKQQLWLLISQICQKLLYVPYRRRPCVQFCTFLILLSVEVQSIKWLLRGKQMDNYFVILHGPCWWLLA